MNKSQRYPVIPAADREAQRERSRALRAKVAQLQEVADSAEEISNSITTSNLGGVRSVVITLVRQVGVLAQAVAELAKQVSGESR